MEEINAIPAPPTTEQPPEQTTPPAPVQTPPADATPAWLKELDTADPETLRRHPKIAGIVGQMFDQHRRRYEAEQAEKTAREKTETAERERAAERERLRTLRKTDWTAYDKEMDAFEEREAREKLERDRGEELTRHLGETRQQFAERIGQAYRNLPEWTELTTEDLEALSEAVAGKPDDEAIGAFAVMAAELLAEKRADKKHAGWKAQELQREREAIRQELAAQNLKATPAPDTRPPQKGPGPVNVWALSDEDAEAFFQRHKTELARRG